MKPFPALALGLLLSAGAAQAQTPPPAAPVAPAAPADDPAAKALAAAQAYLGQNAKQPGVITLPSGLQYKIIHSGDPKGPAPKLGDIVKVHYEGSLTTGEVFDSSFSRGHPAILQLANLVPAWIEALPQMHVGDEWVLYVPPSLGYGERAAGPIPANSVMIFRLQLLGMLSAD